MIFELDGVTFPAAEVGIEFMDPADGGGAMFPTGNLVDALEVPGVGTLDATMINAGIPTIFVKADAIAYTGTELQEAINSDRAALEKFEAIRAHGAIAMGLIQDVSEAAARQHTPKNSICCARNDVHLVKWQRGSCRRHRSLCARTVYGQTPPRHDGHGGSCPLVLRRLFREHL